MFQTKKEIKKEKKLKQMKALVNLIELNENAADTKDEPETKKSKLSESNVEQATDDIKAMKRKIRERNRTSHPPKISLKQQGENAHIDCDPNKRTPIFISDVPNLLLRVLLNELAPKDDWPWYKLEKANNITNTIVLVVEGLSLFHFQSFPQCFQNSLIHFDIKLETVMPPYQGGDELIEELIAVPLTVSQRKELIQEYVSLENAKLHLKKCQTYLSKSVFPIKSDPVSEVEIPKSDNFPRTQLLLSPVQLICEQYPFPMQGALHHRYKNYVFTKNVYAEVKPSSPMFGLDCEMVKTNKNLLELGRISIVNENHETVYESLVRPKSVIIDYLTPHSGLSPELLKNVTKTLEDVQKDIIKILPSDAILVGHSLCNDLIAMRMIHPYVIDTSVIYNRTGLPMYKSKLKVLVKEFFDLSIQNDKFHDSVEDAIAALRLVQLKLSNSIEFGDEVVQSRKRSHLVYSHLKNETGEDNRSDTALKQNLFNTLNESCFTMSCVSSQQTKLDLNKFFPTGELSVNLISTPTNKEAIKKTVELGVTNDFVLTHVKIKNEMDETNVEKYLSRVDKMIHKIWLCMNPNTMFTVILGGSPGAHTGLTLIGIKKKMPNSENKNRTNVLNLNESNICN